MDAAEAMVAKTRERVAAIRGETEAERTVSRGFMEDLSLFPNEEFHLIIALGIYHNAENRAQWETALDESIRVLKTGGRLLVACFSPGSRPDGEPLEPVPGSPDAYTRFSGQPMILVDAVQLDDAFKKRGLIPSVPTKTVKRNTDTGFRLTVNAFYCRE